MKTLIILLLTFSLSQGQQRKPLTWKVENNTLTIKFVNEPFYGAVNPDAYGIYTTPCRENYILLMRNLIDYGNYPIRYTGREFEDTSVEGLRFKISPNYAQLLIFDDSGHLWKISKPEALILASELKTRTINHINAFEYLRVCKCEN